MLIIKGVLLLYIAYNIYKFIYNNDIQSKKINNFLKKYKFENVKEKKFLLKLNTLIEYYNDLKLGKQLGYKEIYISILVVFIVSFFIILLKTKLLFLSIGLAGFISSLIVQFLIVKKNSFEKKFNKNYDILLLNIKNNVKNDNDIVSAIRKTNQNKNLKMYFDDFLNAINNGVNVLESFEYIKNKFHNNDFSNLITIFQNCYIYGGDYYQILDKAEKDISKKKKLKRKNAETNNEIICTVIMMILINMYIIITYILPNESYILLFKENTIGKIIIDLNLIIYMYSYYILFLFYINENK